MNKPSLCCSLGLLLFAAPALFSQTNAPAKASATANAAKGAHPHSAAESNALKALTKMANDPATTGDQLDAALTDFVTKFPQSDYLASVAVLGLQFNQDPAHANYEKSLLYGEQALKADPKNLYALATLANIIPTHVTDTDLDRDQRLQEATDDANQSIAIAQSPGATVNGQSLPDSARRQIQSIAYAALARIENVKKNYPAVIADYQKAIPFADPAHQAVDYFYEARAQIALKQYPDALTSLDGAAKAAPNDPNVQAAVTSNRKLIAQLQAGH